MQLKPGCIFYIVKVKNTFFIILAIFLFNSSSSQGIFKSGVNLGLATSQIHGDTYSGFDKAGLTGGATLSAILDNRSQLRFEINYIQKGARRNPDAEKGDYRYYLARLNYIEIPLLYRFKYKTFYLEAGLQYGYLFSSFEENEVQTITKGFRKSDFNLAAGLGFIFGKNWELICRSTNTVVPIRKFDTPLYYRNWFLNQFNSGYYNNVITFSLHYYFKEHE